MGRAVNMARHTILVQEITNSVLRNPDALISVARRKPRRQLHLYALGGR